MAEIKRLSTELQVKDKLLDTSGDAGTSGQILSSTGTGTNWIDAAAFNGGTVANASTFSSTVTFSSMPILNSDILVNGHVYGRAVDGESSRLYRFGGVYLTWDSDSYGTNDHHSLRSTYGNSFTDSITLNSFNHIRFNIDSNDNNSTSYFEVGDGTTSTSNVIFRIDQAGDVTITGDSTTSGDFTIADNKGLMLGTGGDAFFKHTGSAFNFFNDTGHVTFIQRVTDGNISFKSDDGSGGETEYFKLEGANTRVLYSKPINLIDGVPLQIGNSQDLRLYHNGSHSYIAQAGVGNLYIQQEVNDGDIIFLSDDGSGGVTNYIQIDGSEGRTLFNKHIRVNDNVQIQIGSSNDAYITHNGSNTYFVNGVGNLEITNDTNDGDIIFKSDDGSGGTTEYMRIDGGAEYISIKKNTVHPDSVATYWGDANDLQIYHDSSNSHVVNLVGNLRIRNFADDSDITFESDNMSGGTTEYIRLDGGIGETVFSRNTRHGDQVHAQFGDSNDLKIYHNSSNDRGYIYNGTGDLYIENDATDGDIKFYSDDGSGGTAQYFRVDGGEVETRFLKSTLHFDNVKAKFGDGGDLEIYHDGSNSYIRDTGTGNLYIDATSQIIFRDYGSAEEMAKFINDGAIELYYDNTKKFETTSAGATVTGNLSVTGDLNITGDINSVNVTNLDVDDKTITLGKGQDETHSDGSGIVVDGSNASILWDEPNNEWEVNKDLSIYTGAGIATLIVGRNSSERLIIDQTDNETVLTADNDSDGDSEHNFRLNRTFEGSGANNFKIQKGGTDQLTIDTNANATFAGDVQTNKLQLSSDAEHFVSFRTTSLVNTSTTVDTTAISGRRIDLYAYDDIKLRAGTTDSIYLMSGGSDTLTLNNSSNATFAGNVNLTDYQSGTVTTRIPRLLNVVVEPNPETKNEFVHPYFLNDLANFKARGGTITFGGLSSNPTTSLNEPFAASAKFLGVQNSVMTGSTWTITLTSTGDAAFNLNYGATVGICFGSMTFAPSSCKIEINDANDGSGTWTTVLDSNVRDTVYVAFNSTGSSGARAIRYTLGKYASYDPRITNIFAYNYSSQGMTKYFLPLAGGKIYGQLNTAGNRIINIGAPTASTDAATKAYVDTAVSGAGSGTFLPLAGGTMTDTLTVDGGGSSSVLLKTKGSARIALENANATDSFYISNTGGNNASVLDLGGALSIVEGGDATFAGKIYGVDGAAGTPTYSFSGRTDTGMYARDHSSNDRLAFSTDGSERGYFDSNGLQVIGNLYLNDGNSVRNYSGTWRATTGTSGNGFTFANTADNSGAVLLSITSDSSAASASVATFAGDILAEGGDITVKDTGTENAMFRAYATGTGYAGIIMDASNGDGAGSDYFTIRQLDNKQVEFNSRANAGNTLFYSKGALNLTQDGANSTFAGNINLASSNINIDNNGAVIFDNSNNNNAWYIRNGGTSSATLQFGLGDNPGANIKHTFDGSGNIAFGGDVTVNGGHLTLKNGTTYAQATDYLYIGGSGLDNADAAIYLGNRGDGNSYGWRFIYKGTGSGNGNNLIIQSENATNPVDALTFKQDGFATFANDVTIGDDLNISGEELTFTNDAASAYIRGADALLIQSDYNGGENKPIYLQPSAVSELTVATGISTFAGSVHLDNDSAQLQFGDDNDMQMFHNGSNGEINIDTGSFTIDSAGSITLDAANTVEISSISRFSSSARFTSNATFDNDSKAKFGDDEDLEIYHSGSHSFISAANGTGSLYIRPGTGNTVQIEDKDGNDMITASPTAVRLLYNNSEKLATTSNGIGISDYLVHLGDTNTFFKFNSGGWEIQSSGGPTTDISATGGVTSIFGKGSVAISCGTGQVSTFSGNISPGTNKVLDRDIPCLFNSNFEDAYGTAIVVVPFNNNTENNVSSRTYNHNLTMPYAGKLTKIVLKHVSGTLSSGFTTQLFLYVNGSQQASSSEISLSGSSVTWTPTTNNTFSAGDVLSFGYQKSAIKTFGGVSFGVAIELTDYDI